MRPFTRDYADVDSAPEPEAILARLDQVETFGPHIEVRERTYEFVPGGDGVDVGCGHGKAVAELCERRIDAVGVDPSNFLVDAARRRFPYCTFLNGSASALPFPDHSLQWYRAERVYMHLNDAPSAVQEANRVLAPGGTIIIADQDFDGTIITSADPALTRNIVKAFTDSLPQGRSGSRIRGTLAQAGFTDVTVTAVPMVYTKLDAMEQRFPEQAMSLAMEAGVLSAQQADSWMADLQQRDRDQDFMFAHLMFITTARTPDAEP